MVNMNKYGSSINQFYFKIHAYNTQCSQAFMFTFKIIIIHIFPRNQYKPKVVTSQYKKNNYKLGVNTNFEGIGTCTIE